MPIEKTWIIVDLHTARALTHAEEPHRSVRFSTRESAVRTAQHFLRAERVRAESCAGSYDLGRYLVVELTV